MSGNARRAVADDFGSRMRDHMPSQPIERAAAHRLAAFEPQRDRIAVVVEILNLAVVFQRNQIVALAGAQIDAVNIGPMRHRIRLAEVLAERLAQRNAGDRLAGQRVAHFERRRHPGVRQHIGLEPDALDGAKNVRPELDAGAQFLEFRRLLEHPHRKTLARQRISRHQPADAAAGDQKGGGTAIGVGHRVTSLRQKKRVSFTRNITAAAADKSGWRTVTKKPAGCGRRAKRRWDRSVTSRAGRAVHRLCWWRCGR